MHGYAPMTVDHIRERVAHIASITADFEAAHSEEDSLHRDVLEAIADDRCDDPKACAAEALKTWEIEFARYCT